MKLFKFIVESYKYYFHQNDGSIWFSIIGFVGLMLNISLMLILYISWETPPNDLIRFMSLCFLIMMLPPIAYYFKTKKDLK